MIVEGFLGIPCFDVGAYGLVGRNLDVEGYVSFVKLASLHIEVCDLDFHSDYFRVKGV